MAESESLLLLISAVWTGVTGGCLYVFARLEMSRENAWSLAVVGTASELVLIALWVLVRGA